MITFVPKGFLQLFRLVILSVIAGLLSSANTLAQPVLKFQPRSASFAEVTDIQNAGDASQRLFIVQKSGAIKIYKNGEVLGTDFLNLTNIISYDGERGLLSIAFDPDYKNNRKFYVYYTNINSDITLARYTTSLENPDSADKNSGVVLFSKSKEGGIFGHTGGQLHFGKDGYLYLSIGELQTQSNAQDSKVFFGKMIRINVANADVAPYYTIPPDNPFVNAADTLPEIYAMGLRNPWHWSFDRETGDTWIGDVGAGFWEEVDFETPATAAGINYGWPCYEGDSVYSTDGCGDKASYTFPIYAYGHDDQNSGYSITGGYVYRGNDYPLLKGYYVCADFGKNEAHLIKPKDGGGWDAFVQSDIPAYITSFGEDESGELYAATLTGKLYRVTADEVLPAKLISFTVQQAQAKGSVTLKWQTAFEQNVLSFQVQTGRDGRNFSVAGTIAANNLATGSTYTFNHIPFSNGKIFYRLAIKSKDGTITYSDVINFVQNNAMRSYIYPTVVENNKLTIVLNEPFNMVHIFNISGREVLQKNIEGETGGLVLNLPKLTSGTYIVQLTGVNPVVQKIVVR